MDGAIAGLIGSLGGVVLGVSAQSIQARWQRRWQVADRGNDMARAQSDRLWQERRVAYSAFMEAASDLMRRLDFAWKMKADLPPTAEVPAGHPYFAATTEAMNALHEALNTASRRAEEVNLLTQSAAIVVSVNGLISVIASVDFNEVHEGNHEFNQQRPALATELAGMYRAFTAAARAELGIPALERPHGA